MSSPSKATYLIDQGGARVRVCFHVKNGKVLQKAQPCDNCHKFFISASTVRVLVNEERFRNFCPYCIPLRPSVWLPNLK